jgi:pimeloyl-ACP methyl ester carboxylesterase
MKLLLLCSTVLLAVSTTPPPTKHLVVLVHGLSGTAADLGYLARRLEADSSVSVLASGANEPFPRTLDGVDAGGARLADEVRQAAARTRYETISFVGNSLGGLYARAALRTLRDAGADTFAGLAPAVFVTTAAPHLGARLTQYGPLAPLLRLLPSSISIAKSARDAMLQTSTVAELSKGEALAALALFAKRRAYGSANGDFMVPTASALFTAASADKLRGAGMRLHDADAPTNGAAYLIRDLDGVDAEELPPAYSALAAALENVGFERVMVEFESPGPLGTPFAHNKLVALERRPGPTGKLIKYLELTADGRPVMDGLARYILEELAAL